MSDAFPARTIYRTLSVLDALELTVARRFTRHPLNLERTSRFDLIEGVPQGRRRRRLAIFHGVLRSRLLRLPAIFQPMKDA